MLLLNIQGFRTNCAELTACIRMMNPTPALVRLNETFLNKSVKEVSLEGFELVARRDRDTKKQGGGSCASEPRWATQLSH